MKIQLPKINMAWENDLYIAFSHDYSRFYDATGALEIEAIAILGMMVLYGEYNLEFVVVNGDRQDVANLLSDHGLIEHSQECQSSIKLEVEVPECTYSENIAQCSDVSGQSESLAAAVAIAVLRWLDRSGKLEKFIHDDEFVTFNELFSKNTH